ncbi:MAG: hypothetical protein HQ479_02940 [Rhodobacter sp.]|nr:hypothetical protein [Rhodobacter sp.]
MLLDRISQLNFQLYQLDFQEHRVIGIFGSIAPLQFIYLFLNPPDILFNPVDPDLQIAVFGAEIIAALHFFYGCLAANRADFCPARPSK